MGNFKLIGHRGYGPTYHLPARSVLRRKLPENSLAAFRYALDAGADGFEMDIQTSLDGIPVVFHDKKLPPHLVPTAKTDDDLKIGALTFEQIAQIDIGGGQRIPALESVVMLCAQYQKELFVNFDLKDAHSIDAVAGIISSYPEFQRNDLIVSSYDWNVLKAFRQASQHARLAAAIKTRILFGPDNVSMPDYVPLVDHYDPAVKGQLKTLKRELGICGIDCTFTDFRPQLVDWARELGLGLQISTANKRVKANEIDRGTLLQLHAASFYPEIPFVACKVDDADKVSAVLRQALKGDRPRKALTL